MPIRVVCSCGKALLAPDDYTRPTARCPSCGQTVAMPTIPDLPAPAETGSGAVPAFTKRSFGFVHFFQIVFSHVKNRWLSKLSDRTKTAILAGAIGVLIGWFCRDGVGLLHKWGGEPIESHYSTGEIVERYYVIQDAFGNYIRHGTYTSWSKFGVKDKEGKYRNGNRHGKWTTWDFQGKKTWEGTFRDGKKDGICFWYKDFHKTAQEQYRDDKVNGKVIHWYESGQKKMEGTYLNGKEDGKFTWWKEDGSISGQKEYKDGKPLD